MTHSQIQLKIGPYSILPIHTGLFGLDGGAMFGTVPKVLWEKSNPADSQNRIQMAARALLLRSKDRNILIDTGNGGDFVEKYGEKFGTKFKEMFNLDNSGEPLIESLKELQLTPDDITDVLLTHLHFDHAGGATKYENGKIVPTFKHAKYYVQKGNFDLAQNPNLREKASYYNINFMPIFENQQLQLLNSEVQNLFDGISILVSHGHTSFQQIIKISDPHNTLLYCGDVIPTSSHVRLPWLMGYDLNPLLLMEEKSQILSNAADNNWFLFFEHDPYCHAAQIEKNGKDFKLKQTFILS